MTIMSDNTGQPYVSVELDDNGEMVSGVRQDGLHDVSLSLDMEMWGILGLQAHAADITLNEHLINVIMASVADTDGMELTPDEWLQYDPDFKYSNAKRYILHI